MDLKEIFKNLCYYDKRNPDYFEGYYSEKPNPCYCTNCLHGTKARKVKYTDTTIEEGT